MHVHTLYVSSERTSANVPRQSYEYANQSLVYAALPNETPRSPRGSTMLLNIHGYLSAMQPALAGLATWTRRRIFIGRSPDQPSMPSEPRALTSRGRCTVRRWAEKIPAVCRIVLPSWSKMIIAFIVGIQENESFVVHPFRGSRRVSTHRGDNIKRRKKIPKYFLDHPCLPLCENTRLSELKRFPSSEKSLKSVSHTTEDDVP